MFTISFCFGVCARTLEFISTALPEAVSLDMLHGFIVVTSPDKRSFFFFLRVGLLCLAAKKHSLALGYTSDRSAVSDGVKIKQV